MLNYFIFIIWYSQIYGFILKVLNKLSSKLFRKIQSKYNSYFHITPQIHVQKESLIKNISYSIFLPLYCRPHRYPSVHGSRGCKARTIWETGGCVGLWDHAVHPALRLSPFHGNQRTAGRAYCTGEISCTTFCWCCFCHSLA